MEDFNNSLNSTDTPCHYMLNADSCRISYSTTCPREDSVQETSHSCLHYHHLRKIYNRVQGRIKRVLMERSSFSAAN